MYRYDKQTLISVARSHYSRTRRVRFQEVDAAGIIFYSTVLDYCHDLYVDYLDSCGVRLAEVLQARTWAAPIRHAEADYLSPLRFGVDVEVGLSLAHVTESEMTLGYRVVDATAQRLAAVAQTVHTFVALPAFERCPVPPEIAEAFQALT